jgi:TetR/AcrR family transcriptional regulator, cholesterol catabolism regulator
MSTTEPRVSTRLAGDVRRRQIRAEAARLFDEFGYGETSMDKIADAVGIRKASLYYYFPSKDRLLIEMHDEMLELIMSAHESRVAAKASAEEQIIGMITDIISLQETHPGSLRVFFEHYRELPEPERGEIAARRSRYGDFMRQALDAGVASGEFAPMDTRLTSFAILGMANWSYQWFTPGGRMTAADVAASFWAVARGGISR